MSAVSPTTSCPPRSGWLGPPADVPPHPIATTAEASPATTAAHRAPPLPSLLKSIGRRYTNDRFFVKTNDRFFRGDVAERYDASLVNESVSPGWKPSVIAIVAFGSVVSSRTVIVTGKLSAVGGR